MTGEFELKSGMDSEFEHVRVFADEQGNDEKESV